MLAIIPAAGTDKVFKTSLKHVLDEDFRKRRLSTVWQILIFLRG